MKVMKIYYFQNRDLKSKQHKEKPEKHFRFPGLRRDGCPKIMRGFG